MVKDYAYPEKYMYELQVPELLTYPDSIFHVQRPWTVNHSSPWNSLPAPLSHVTRVTREPMWKKISGFFDLMSINISHVDGTLADHQFLSKIIKIKDRILDCVS